MLVYYKEVSLEEGFEVMSKERAQRLVGGRRVSSPGGKVLFEAIRAAGQSLSCWKCGLTATCFIANKGHKDLLGPPVLDLYASTGTDYILMTRDHIIPKSYGGSNDVQNLRVACGPCNHDRGNALDEEDIKFMNTHPELIVPGEKLVLPKGITTVEKTVGVKVTGEGLTEAERKERKRLKNKQKRKKIALAKQARKLPPLSSMLALALA